MKRTLSENGKRPFHLSEKRSFSTVLKQKSEPGAVRFPARNRKGSFDFTKKKE